MEIINLNHVSLKSMNINERKIQTFIAEHPECLELGELEYKDRERPVQSGGFIDLLFQDSRSKTRYIVEVQRGDVDPSHILRTIEYVDLESRRFPRFKHVGVLVAENVTGRFLNVLQILSNHGIKLVVYTLSAAEVDGNICLNFVKVIDDRWMDEDDDIDVNESIGEEEISREWYETAYGKEPMEKVDWILENVVNAIDSSVEPNYKKSYIGLQVNGVPNNWCLVWPHKTYVDLSFKYAVDDDGLARLEELGLKAKVKAWSGANLTILTLPLDFELDDDQTAELKALAEKSKSKAN